MAGNGNGMAQILKLLGQMHIRMHESDKKIKLMATTLQTLTKSTPREKDEIPHRGWENDKKKEEKGGKENSLN